jgi:hypothetical protein
MSRISRPTLRTAPVGTPLRSGRTDPASAAAPLGHGRFGGEGLRHPHRPVGRESTDRSLSQHASDARRTGTQLALPQRNVTNRHPLWAATNDAALRGHGRNVPKEGRLCAGSHKRIPERCTASVSRGPPDRHLRSPASMTDGARGTARPAITQLVLRQARAWELQTPCHAVERLRPALGPSRPARDIPDRAETG